MLETERLILRKFKMEDKDDCFAFLSDKQTCLDDGGYPAFDSQDEKYMHIMEKFLNEEKRYMIVEKKSGHVIGTVDIMDSDDNQEIVSIGYVVAPKYRRQGYAYEAVQKVMEYYFEYAGVKKFLATCFTYNQASKRLLKKLGFVHDGVIEMGIEHAELGKLDLESYYWEKRTKACNMQR